MPLEFPQLSETHRRLDFENNYKPYDGRIVHSSDSETFKPESSTERKDTTKTLYISHALRDQKYASLLARLFKIFHQDFDVTEKESNDSHAMELIDKSNCIIILLSPNYQNSQKEIEGLNTALSRQRTATEQVIYCVLLEKLKETPTYMNLIHASTSLVDGFWQTISKKNAPLHTSVQAAQKEVTAKFDPISDVEMLALTKVCYDVGAIINKNR